jgi:cytochrome c peroxidase
MTTPTTANRADDGRHGGRRRQGGREAAGRQGRLGDRAGRKALDQVRTLPLDLTKLPDVAKKIEEGGRYGEAFQAAFGSRSVTTARLAEAIASYCRSIQSSEAPVDRYLAGQREALSAAARRGLELFRGRAACAQCHVVEGARPTFSDFDFHNTGIVWSGRNSAVKAGEEEIDLDVIQRSDRGRELFSRSSGDRRAFKTPTLRDLTRRGPYMHDGSFRTLEGVVRYYAGGGSKDDHQDKRLRGFKVSDEEVADLVAFLESLTGDEVPGRAPRAWYQRAERQRVRLVDGRGRPLAGMPVTLTPEGDDLPVAGRERAAAVEAFADLEGWLEFAPSCRTHMRLGLPEGLTPEGGGLIPDTCALTTLTVPVDGRVTLVVSFEAGAAAPELLVAEHELTMRLPGHAAPRTVFKRVTVMNLAGREVGSYEGWRRTDRPPEVIVRFPGDKRARPEHRLRLSDERTLKLDLGE